MIVFLTYLLQDIVYIFQCSDYSHHQFSFARGFSHTRVAGGHRKLS